MLGVVQQFLRQHCGRHRRHKRIGIDLPVRIMQGHADFGAAVLERQHVPDGAALRRAFGAVAPHFEQQFDAAQGQRGQRAARILGKYHHLAMAGGRRARHTDGGRVEGVQRHRREAVAEHRDFVVAWRQFGRRRRVGRHGKRVVLGCRLEGAVLPISRVSHPFAAQWMPAKVRVGVEPVGNRTGRGTGRCDRRAAVQRKRAAVRLQVVNQVHESNHRRQQQHVTSVTWQFSKISIYARQACILEFVLNAAARTVPGSERDLHSPCGGTALCVTFCSSTLTKIRDKN